MAKISKEAKTAKAAKKKNSEADGYSEMTDKTVKLDWDKVGQLVGKGRYRAKISGAEYKKSRSDQHMIVVSLEMTAVLDEDKDRKKENKQFIGRSINYVNLVFSQEGAFLAKDLFKALKIKAPKAINRQVLEEIAERLLGKEVGVVISEREYEGRKRPQVASFFDPKASEKDDGEDDVAEKDDEDEDEDEDDEEDEDDDEEEEEEDEDEEDEDDDDDEEEEDDEDEDDDDDEDEDDDDEDDDDDDDVKAKSKSKNGSPAAASKAKASTKSNAKGGTKSKSARA